MTQPTPEPVPTLFDMSPEEFRAHNARLLAQAAAWGPATRTFGPDPVGPLGLDPDTDGRKAHGPRPRLPHGPRLRNI